LASQVEDPKDRLEHCIYQRCRFGSKVSLALTYSHDWRAFVAVLRGSSKVKIKNKMVSHLAQNNHHHSLVCTQKQARQDSIDCHLLLRLYFEVPRKKPSKKQPNSTLIVREPVNLLALRGASTGCFRLVRCRQALWMQKARQILTLISTLLSMNDQCLHLCRMLQCALTTTLVPTAGSAAVLSYAASADSDCRDEEGS
jgi:hypothetical protein